MQNVASSKAPLLRSLLLEALADIVGVFLKTNERGTIPSPLIIRLTHTLFITDFVNRLKDWKAFFFFNSGLDEEQTRIKIPGRNINSLR